jgi:hypothetical protein
LKNPGRQNRRRDAQQPAFSHALDPLLPVAKVSFREVKSCVDVNRELT